MKQDLHVLLLQALALASAIGLLGFVRWISS